MQLRLKFILLFSVLCFGVFGQDNEKSATGRVSFITSQNVYVKFENTDLINIGDTLLLSNKKSLCLVVSNKSSNSCVCLRINDCEISKDDQVLHIKQSGKSDQKVKEVLSKSDSKEDVDSTGADSQTAKDSKYEEKIKGKISISSYSNISNTRDDRHRLMSRFSLNADHINNSDFSFNTYINYRQNINQGQTTSPDISSFKVYNLSACYDINPKLSVVLGRNINPKMSSVGAIDGLQLEKYFGKSYIGIVSGFRPDIYEYNFNSQLLEYGGYIGTTTDKENFYSQSTLGIMEQRNNGRTDRRYAYFQHSSTIAKSLYVFSSLELDLYNSMSDTLGDAVRLTNLYSSLRYRFSRKFDITVSYDSRKMILYYETFQTEIERLLNDDIARQGLRIRANVKPIKYMSLGGSYSKRFQSDNQNKSNNVYAYASFSKIPGIGGRLAVNFNLNASNYIESKAFSYRYSRTLINTKLDIDLYYRHIDYTYLNSERKLLQDFYGVNFSYFINRKLLFSLSGELSNYNQENNYRVYAKFIKRFNISTIK